MKDYLMFFYLNLFYTFDQLALHSAMICMIIDLVLSDMTGYSGNKLLIRYAKRCDCIVPYV